MSELQSLDYYNIPKSAGANVMITQSYRHVSTSSSLAYLSTYFGYTLEGQYNTDELRQYRGPLIINPVGIRYAPTNDDMDFNNNDGWIKVAVKIDYKQYIITKYNTNKTIKEMRWRWAGRKAMNGTGTVEKYEIGFNVYDPNQKKWVDSANQYYVEFENMERVTVKNYNGDDIVIGAPNTYSANSLIYIYRVRINPKNERGISFKIRPKIAYKLSEYGLEKFSTKKIYGINSSDIDVIVPSKGDKKYNYTYKDIF
jgi:hypothetical protein